MKLLTTHLCVWLFVGQVFSQPRPENQKPLIPNPTPATWDYESTLKNLPVKSFYESKDDWQTIIDTTWGPGLPLVEKLNIFNAYTQALTEKFDGFNSLGIDMVEWDLIKDSYLSRIDASTSRGAFSELMSRLAYDLDDLHTYAWDDTVVFTPLNPGTPLLVLGNYHIEHFGAVLTVLPDSNLLVLRILENHPLGLQPGDIVLGYEGVAWKDLVDELLEFGIPSCASARGAKSALRYSQLVSAGMNWHLFDTIDIVKHASGDTVHLSVYPLLELPVPTGSIWVGGGENLFWNNEQLPVPGIPFPDPNEIDERALTYGIVEGTNIGYIYLYMEVYEGWEWGYNTNDQFYEAISSLMETDGLIIDIRLNGGGWALLDDSFELLFNELLYTIQDAYRCNPDNFILCPFDDQDWFKIPGKSMSLYDRPLAVLIGPNCSSMGDLTAHRLLYHPMTKFFGKSTCECFGDNEYLETFPEWTLRYSKSDMFHIAYPETYLNRSEFPVDDTIWFDRDGVANGEDAVVNRALEWINNLSYAHEVSVQPIYANPGSDEITVTVEVENPNSHSLSVCAKIINTDKMPVDSVPLFDDGVHGDGDPCDGTWGVLWPVPSGETIYKASITTDDTTAGTSCTLPNVVQFTTMGPVVYDGLTFTGADATPNPGDYIYFKIALRNEGFEAIVTSVTAKLTSLDTLILMMDSIKPFSNIQPGRFSTNTGNYILHISEDCPINTEIPIQVEVYSNDYIFWNDLFSINVREPSGTENNREFLTRIYPNPANNLVNIEIGNSGMQGIEIELFTITGKVIYRKEFKNSSVHLVEQIDLSGYSKGLYFVRVKQVHKVYIGKVIVR